MEPTLVPDQTAVGGASTTRGILAQAFWSLFRLSPAGELKIQSCDLSSKTLLLVLEPMSGGDITATTTAARVVEQLKARADGGSWSFRDFVSEVLPDLFKASGDNSVQTTYRFVTEGKVGEWVEVKQLFESLSSRSFDRGLQALNDSTPLATGHHPRKKAARKKATTKKARGPKANQTTFEFPEQTTERAVFIVVAAFLHQRPIEQLDESELRRVWDFLSNLTIEPGVNFSDAERMINEWLAGYVEAIEKRREIKQAMITSLQTKAARGNSVVTTQGLLQEFGLSGVSLADWSALVAQNRTWLGHEFESINFDPTADVRANLAREKLAAWTIERPVLLLVGESGQGKSWLAASMMQAAVERDELAWSVSAKSDCSQTIAAAAQCFWTELARQDIDKPLSRIRERFRLLTTTHEDRAVRVFVENVIDPNEGIELARQHWKQWGLHIAMTCRPDVADAIQTQAPNVCQRVDVSDFSEPELRRYLEAVFRDKWLQIPADIRRTLQRPLLAYLYRELGTASDLAPSTEYELYAAVWDRLRSHPTMVLHSADIVSFRRCISAVFENGVTYPWSLDSLVNLGLNSDAIDRLHRIGWLSKPTHEQYRVWHDRLLNWGLAEALAADLREHRKSIEAVCELVKPLLHERRGGVFWGYVVMDLLWLVVRSNWPSAQNFIDAYFRALEALPRNRGDDVYSDDVITLGAQVVPHLLRRVEQAGLESNEWIIKDIAKALAAIGSDAVPIKEVMKLLAHDSGRVRRAGMLVATRIPAPQYLDRLWQLHCDREHDHSQFDWHEERGGEYRSYEDSMAGLRACVKLNPDWIIDVVHRPHESDSPTWDLGWLIHSLVNGSHIWDGCRNRLFDLLSNEKPRVLAANMGTWRDRSRIDWLVEHVPSKVDRVGPSAFDALVQLDEAAAFECLRTADPFDLSPTRSWWLPRLLLRSPEAVEQQFSDEIQRRHGREIDHLLSVFQGYEDEMPPRLVDLLLDRLEEQLGEALRNTDPEHHRHHIIEFGMLTKVARRDAFECFRRRRGSELEQQLRDWLLQIPINNSNWHSGEHNDGLGVLARIGGQGFSDVLNHWLENGEYWGRWLCWKFASRRYDARTIELLCMRSQRVEMHPGSEFVLEDSKAAQALAALDQWDPVCRYVRKAKAKVQSDVADFQPDATEFSEPLLDELRNGDTQDPGTIGGMGFTGRAEFRDKVIKTLSCATPDSDLARVCALALDDLGDNS